MSALYAPFKAIGYVTDENPFKINRLGDEIFLTVSVGHHFQVYRVNKLTVCLVSKRCPGLIKALEVIYEISYCVW